MGTAPLPRKILGNERLASELAKAHVQDLSKELWVLARKERPKDTFIGLVSTPDWKFYIAPIFGVPKDVWKRVWNDNQDAAMKTITEDGDVRQISKENVIVSPTSGSADLELSVAVEDVEKVYKGKACYVLLTETAKDKHNFDGRSHRGLAAWIHRNSKSSFDIQQSLGFAIQWDQSGYYVRFASGLNQDLGNDPNKGPTFEKRANPAKGRGKEPRDLPNQWAQFVEHILERDLNLRILRPYWPFDRVVSRGEKQTAKILRFEPHLDAKHPGTAGTGNRLV